MCRCVCQRQNKPQLRELVDMKRYATYLSYGELEFLASALHDLEDLRGFHERGAIRRLRSRLEAKMELILADAAAEDGGE